MISAFDDDEFRRKSSLFEHSGEDFERKRQAKEKEKRKALRSAKLPSDWRATRLTPEERWDLYKSTGGGKLPCLFFGVRSHRLLVRGRRGPASVRLALTGVRLAWLNWAFPVWTSIVVLVLALHAGSSLMKVVIAVAAGALVLNTLGTLVGGAFSAITMGGFSRHHDNVPTKEEALNNAAVEFGYGLTAAIIYVLSGAVFVQAMALMYGDGPVRITLDSFSASAGMVVNGADGQTLGFGSTWLSVLNWTHLVFPGVAAIAIGITATSSMKMWKAA